jgi:hypothetical protein
MKKEQSIIQVIKSADPVFNAHLDSLNEDNSPWKEPDSFLNLETRETYLWLAGGIGWPCKDLPGFVVVVAVSKMPGEGADAPLFTCLDELEDDGIEGLLEGCLRFRDRYRPEKNDTLFRFWYGDPDPFVTELNRFHLKLLKEDEKAYGISASAPYDFEKPNHFDLYRRRIKSLGEGKSLIIARKCTALLNRLQGVPKEQDSGDFPAVIALGGVVSSLMVSHPWTVRTQVGANDGSWEDFALGERERDPFFKK